ALFLDDAGYMAQNPNAIIKPNIAADFHFGAVSANGGVVVLPAADSVFSFSMWLFKHQDWSTSNSGRVANFATHCAKLWLVLESAEPLSQQPVSRRMETLALVSLDLIPQAEDVRPGKV
ncbi:MAG: hypothetical protein Q9181_006341, partial [Wetmoreana brouardii]